MSRTTYKIRRARKQHRCTERSYHTINIGDLYLYCAYPPEGEFNRGHGWEIIKACLACAEYYSLHTNETREQCQRKSSKKPSNAALTCATTAERTASESDTTVAMPATATPA